MSAGSNDRYKNITFLLMDCDGVLTDGRLYFSETGEALKAFDVRDGYGIVSWHKAGFRSGIISGRKSQIVDMRASSLGIEFVMQGRENKEAAFRQLLAIAAVRPEEIAFIADDTIDLPLFPLVGATFAPADAHRDARAAAGMVTTAGGGRGAVREVIDILLAAT